MTSGAPWAICITPGASQFLYVADAVPGRIYKVTLDGKVLGTLGEAGKQVKQFGWIHEICVPVGELPVRGRAAQLADAEADPAPVASRPHPRIAASDFRQQCVRLIHEAAQRSAPVVPRYFFSGTSLFADESFVTHLARVVRCRVARSPRRARRLRQGAGAAASPADRGQRDSRQADVGAVRHRCQRHRHADANGGRLAAGRRHHPRRQLRRGPGSDEGSGAVPPRPSSISGDVRPGDRNPRARQGDGGVRPGAVRAL